MEKDDLLVALPEMIRQAYDPEIEWIEDPQRADSRTYRGHESVLESWTQWLEGFEEYGGRARGDPRLRRQGRHDAGGGARGASGATVSARVYAVMTFRDAKILRYQEFYDERMASEAAGLSE